MKHTVKSTKKISFQDILVYIELLPENDVEKNAIKNVEACTASDKEREFVNDYLLLNTEVAGQVIEAKQAGNLFVLKVFQSRD